MKHGMQGWQRCYHQRTGKNQRALACKQATDKVKAGLICGSQ